jgi:hypothetical protein
MRSLLFIQQGQAYIPLAMSLQKLDSISEILIGPLAPSDVEDELRSLLSDLGYGPVENSPVKSESKTIREMSWSPAVLRGSLRLHLLSHTLHCADTHTQLASGADDPFPGQQGFSDTALDRG